MPLSKGASPNSCAARHRNKTGIATGLSNTKAFPGYIIQKGTDTTKKQPPQQTVVVGASVHLLANWDIR